MIPRFLPAVLLAIQMLTYSGQSAAEALAVPLVTYYDYAPFSIKDASTDLTRELAALLTKNSGGRYRFVTALLPKRRLDNSIQYASWQGVVAWIHPRFVNDEEKQRFVWSEPVLQESDLVVSHVDAPIHYTGTESLRGKVLGAVLNQRYADVEGMIAKKQLYRSDAPSQESNVRKLLLKRVDVIFVSRSTLSEMIHRVPEFEHQVYVAARLRGSFTRHLMLTPGLPPELIAYVKEIAEKLGRDRGWRDIMARYHLEGPMVSQPVVPQPPHAASALH